jgi:hypothetical protein
LARAHDAHPTDQAVALGQVRLLLDDHRPVTVASAEAEADLLAIVGLPEAVRSQAAEVDLGGAGLP